MIPKKGGRPTDVDRVRAEAKRRLASGEAPPPTLAAFSRELHEWLDAQPGALRAPMTRKVLASVTIETRVRELWNEHRQKLRHTRNRPSTLSSIERPAGHRLHPPEGKCCPCPQ